MEIFNEKKNFNVLMFNCKDEIYIVYTTYNENYTTYTSLTQKFIITENNSSGIFKILYNLIKINL